MSTLGQLNMQGQDKIEVSIDRIREFEPKEGYYLAFSGGKDSIAVKKLMDLAEVKYDAHYNHETVAPPELIYYIREKHPDVKIERPEKTMWELIPQKKMPPTRRARYCCDVLKEGGGAGRFVATGVRWSESVRRKNTRQVIEFDRYGSQAKKAIERRELFLMNDNDERRRMIENCQIKGKHILNPIIDWTAKEVWEFIKMYNLDYCKLYDEGFDRLGCIGCPMTSIKQREFEFEKYPKFKEAYIRAFERMLIERDKAGLETEWETGEEVMDWWMSQ